MAAGCAVRGGCPSDYIAVAIAIICFLVLLSRSILPCIIHKAPRINGSSFWIPLIQLIASFNLLFSIVMSVNFLRFEKKHWWQSCYVWAVWIEGPFGFGLLLSCRITQAFQLYYIFVKKRLLPIKSYIFLPIVTLPWIFGAALIHAKRPLNHQCHMGIQWTLSVVALHALFILALVAFTRAIRHIEFRFDELKDLWHGILVSATSIGIWVSAYILNEIHDDILWLQVASRFILLVMGGVLVVVFFSISSSQPLLSQISLNKRDNFEFRRMGQALGIPDSGLLLQEEVRSLNPNEPLDKLLLNRRFRQSFISFADSCYAGETVHFFEEVQEHGKIPVDDPVRRIYMARHIIEKYIVAGAEMEVNISHKTRQGILSTQDLAHLDLFTDALNEVIQLMKTNLGKDYWSSIFFIKLREEMSGSHGQEPSHMERWNYSPRLSSAQGSDDPFYQDHLSKSSSFSSPV